MPLPDDIKLDPAMSIEHYLRLVLDKRPQGYDTGWIFRGHRKAAWDLLPMIDRPDFKEYRIERGWNRQEHEVRLFSDFQSGARLHVRIEPRNEWEWLAIAQHHGLATRLLDWTANPLAALYFAVEETKAHDNSAVVCYHHAGKQWMEYSKEHPFSVTELVEFRPAHVTPRITVQGGCFTSHPDPADTAPPCQGILRKIPIPHDKRAIFRDELRRLGVDRAALFPDLDGIALSLNRHLNATGE